MMVYGEDPAKLYTEEEVKNNNAALCMFVLAGLHAAAFVGSSIRVGTQGGGPLDVFALAVSAGFIAGFILLRSHVKRGSFRAVKSGLVLAVLTLLQSIVSALVSQAAIQLVGSSIIAVLALVFVAVIYKSYRLLRATRLASPVAAPQDSFKDYCQRLIALLARVMAADGHIDPRERRTLMGLFEGANISSDDIAQSIDWAIGKPDGTLELAVLEYTESARAIGLGDSAQALIAALTTVAGADGVLTPGEERVIHNIARTAGLRQENVHEHLAQLKADLKQMSAEVAASLLGVAPGATPEDVEAAHHSMTGAIAGCTVDHLGGPLVEHQEQRLRALDRARQVLRG